MGPAPPKAPTLDPRRLRSTSRDTSPLDMSAAGGLPTVITPPASSSSEHDAGAAAASPSAAAAAAAATTAAGAGAGGAIGEGPDEVSGVSTQDGDVDEAPGIATVVSADAASDGWPGVGAGKPPRLPLGARISYLRSHPFRFVSARDYCVLQDFFETDDGTCVAYEVSVQHR